MTAISFTSLQACAASVGLAVVGVAEPQVFQGDADRLRRWQEAGYAGDMDYMQRDPQLFASPDRLLDGTRTIVTVGAFYDRGFREPLRAGYGRIARYAWGRDYHKVLRARLGKLVEEVERQLGFVVRHRIFSDSVPLLERAVAGRAGLGFIGKNTMFITPRAGSFMFLAEVLWDLEVSHIPHTVPSEPQQWQGVLQHGKSRCGSCTNCLSGCPTEAFVSDYVLDARRCISYLTIEKRGALSLEERGWIGEWLFGCDVCQEVCPFNQISLKKSSCPDLPEFKPEAGSGQMLSLAEVLSLRTDASYVKRFAGTPLMRAKRQGLLRNAAIVAANTSVSSLIPLLEEAVLGDPSPVVRQHALWSHWRLSLSEGNAARKKAEKLVSRSLSDPEEQVQQEARLCEQVTASTV
jgi:epoxyqueuosine reductase